MASYLNDLGIVCALGTGKAHVLEEMYGEATPLDCSEQFGFEEGCYLGGVRHVAACIPTALAAYDTRSNRLLFTALQELAPAIETARQGIDPVRIGVVVGTSTSGILESEAAVAAFARNEAVDPHYHYRQQMIGNGAEFISACLGIEGPALTVSTACSSSGNAIVTAARLLATKRCDLVIAGGVDSLCQMTIQGFSSLEAVSRGLCNPFGESRDGINLGEAAALFLISRQPGPIRIMGYGASSDAHHISAPHPEGAGARAAIGDALGMAGLDAAAIDYINLHGTGTVLNDAVEAQLVHRLFGDRTPCSSTKFLTGHTLGAAAAVELGLCWLSMVNGHAAPPHRWLGPYDPELPSILLADASCESPRTCMSNTFAFGGNNVSLVISRVGA